MADVFFLVLAPIQPTDPETGEPAKASPVGIEAVALVRKVISQHPEVLGEDDRTREAIGNKWGAALDEAARDAEGLAPAISARAAVARFLRVLKRSHADGEVLDALADLEEALEQVGPGPGVARMGGDAHKKLCDLLKSPGEDGFRPGVHHVWAHFRSIRKTYEKREDAEAVLAARLAKAVPSLPALEPAKPPELAPASAAAAEIPPAAKTQPAAAAVA
jgi:hypothetical protein